MSEFLKWQLVYVAQTGGKKIEVGEYLVPAEGMASARTYAGCELTWATTPEGHMVAIIPYDEETPGVESAILMLKNPYFLYWQSHIPQGVA
jgi:hypothetical protein